MLLLKARLNSLIELDLFLSQLVILFLKRRILLLQIIVLGFDILALLLHLIAVTHCGVEIFLLLHADLF